MLKFQIRDEEEIKYQDVQNFCLWFLSPRRAHSELCNQSGDEKHGQKGKRVGIFINASSLNYPAGHRFLWEHPVAATKAAVFTLVPTHQRGNPYQNMHSHMERVHRMCECRGRQDPKSDHSECSDA